MGGGVSTPIAAVIDGKQFGAYCNGNKDSTVFCSGPASVSAVATYQCSSTGTEDRYYCLSPTNEAFYCTMAEGVNGQTNLKCRKTRNNGTMPTNGLGTTPTGATVTPPVIATPVSVGANQASFSWSAASAIPSGYTLAGYTLTRTTGTTTTTIPSTTVLTSNAYLDLGLAANTTYTYTVNTILTQNGQSAPASPSSNTITLTTLAGPTLTSGTVTAKSVPLSWTVPSGVASPTYTVWRSDKASAITTGVTDTSYTDTTVTPGKNYSYYVTATGTVTNNTGVTPTSQVQNVASNSLPVTTPAESKTWLWILLGVLGFLFLIALIGGMFAAFR